MTVADQPQRRDFLLGLQCETAVGSQRRQRLIQHLGIGQRPAFRPDCLTDIYPGDIGADIPYQQAAWGQKITTLSGAAGHVGYPAVGGTGNILHRHVR
ncbi:hypothetical protein D3C73_1102540 [compost metagenome]